MSAPAGASRIAPPPAAPSTAGYDAAVAALFARRPEWMVPGLRRIRCLTRHLGAPQHGYDAVHVTGTNGKTSTSRMVTALLREAGRSVGTYTSPHLHDVRERILLDGAPVSRSAFLQALDELAGPIQRTEAELGEMVTFFEALTALGALCFRAAAVDVGVIEVGMGGRWDATNVHDGSVAVIGTVGLDHPELGATVAEVAAEKAGIIKDGAVAVVGPQPPDAGRVIAAEARARGALLLHIGTAFDVADRTPVPGGQDLLLRVGERTYELHLPLHGAHQATNAACALTAVDAMLRDVGGLPPEVARAGFAAVRSPGRLERVDVAGVAPVLLDGAHNPEGARSLVAALRESFGDRRIVAVLGVLADKDVEGIVAAVCEVADEVVATCPPCGRAAPLERLVEAVRRGGRPVIAEPDPAAALARARARTDPHDAVVVTGSLYLVGAVRAALGGGIA